MSDVSEHSSVVLTEHSLASQLVLAEATLNVESTLNSLNLEMIQLLTQALDNWSKRPEVVAVLLTGAGEKAFCAGGDIQALYRAIVSNHQAEEVVNAYPFDFFAQEYALDYQLHTYHKPVICLGHGVVMGGGMGLFSAAEFRVSTERSKLALPEITIGLFPDAGATWSLNQMAPHQAVFLGLTGSHVNAADALTVGLATHVVPHAERSTLLTMLKSVSFSKDADANTQAIADALASLPAVDLPEGEIQQLPDFAITLDNLARQVQALENLEGQSRWIDRGLQNLRGGCPTTAGIVLEQLRRSTDMSLADMFRMEYNIACHCATNLDFAEGVRALLIEKDGSPHWQYPDIDTLPEAHVMAHFSSFETPHPLAGLG
jgi:enoyl-CoA hydratase/carnithine racemase